MQWVLLGLVAIILVVTARYYPRTAFTLLALLITAGIILYRVMEGENDRLSNLISPQQIVFLENEVSEGYAESFVLSLRIRNDAEDATLVELSTVLSMMDCPQDDTADENCEIIGEQVASIPIHVPPGQVRDLTHNFNFGTTRPSGFLRWNTSVVSTRARPGHQYR